MTANRAPLPHDPDQVKDQLRRRIRPLLEALGFQNVPAGPLFMPLNPMRNDKKPGSFCIWLEPVDGAGAWRDYAMSGSAAGGNVYDLIEGCLRLKSWIDAYWWALDWLGMGRGVVRSQAQAEADRQRALRDAAAANERRTADEEAKAEACKALWLKLPPIKGTLGERYLEARGIDLSRLPRLPGALRFAPSLEHWHPETGEITEHPAMVAAFTRGKNITGIHRTYLAPDGTGKADLRGAKGDSVAKLTKGSLRGAAIRLSNGVRDISVNKAAEAGYVCPLMIGEGIETTLTGAMAQPDYRAWAAGNLTLMGLLAWPECASAAVLLGENDGSEAARAAFEKVRRHWEAQRAGRPFKAVFPPPGVKDLNDWKAA